MHCDVHQAAHKGVINLFGEQALAADVSQGLVQNLVPRGLDNNDFEGTLLAQVREVGLQAKANVRNGQLQTGSPITLRRAISMCGPAMAEAWVYMTSLRTMGPDPKLRGLPPGDAGLQVGADSEH